MKTVASSISTYLASMPQTLLMADAYTFTLANGTVLRYTNSQMPFMLGANTWLTGLTIIRSKIRQVIGVEVDTLDLTIAAPPSFTVGGVSLMKALRTGLFDGASVVLNRIFFSAPGVPVNTTGSGDLILFAGIVGEVDAGRFSAQIRVSSNLQLLNIKLPKNVYQPGCPNTLYDTNCGILKSAYAVSGSIAGPSTAGSLVVALSQAAGWFDQGMITFTSGVNSGLSMTIRTQIPSLITPVAPFPSAPATGDTFTIYPGCDKTQATCTSKFSNLANFRGYPYIPVITSVVSV